MNRTLVLHSADRAYARAVDADFEERLETGVVRPAGRLADLDDSWLDVVDRVVVYRDIDLDDGVIRLLGIARFLGLPIEERTIGWKPGWWSRIIGRLAA